MINFVDFFIEIIIKLGSCDCCLSADKIRLSNTLKELNSDQVDRLLECIKICTKSGALPNCINNNANLRNSISGAIYGDNNVIYNTQTCSDEYFFKNELDHLNKLLIEKDKLLADKDKIIETQSKLIYLTSTHSQ